MIISVVERDVKNTAMLIIEMLTAHDACLGLCHLSPFSMRISTSLKATLLW